MEKYKAIKDYEGLYEVSNLGNVKALTKTTYQNGKPQVYAEKIMKQEVTYKGYTRVMLSKQGVVKKIYVHRLVAIAFLKNRDGATEINHKNLIKGDNRAENLEWVNGSENVQHYRRSLTKTQ